jgi:hypothetical protein
MSARERDLALNAICPYFTMFPLEFPLAILQAHASPHDLVLDPFCGRGTTNFAARLLGLRSLGVDSNPVATAITAAKLTTVTVNEIMAEARAILSAGEPEQVPLGEFWRWAFHPTVLPALCRLRESLLEDCSTSARVALRGILLGALHGPRQKRVAGYLSNQCPRTYAPKPAYALRFWKAHHLQPEPVDVLAVIERRAKRYYERVWPTLGQVRQADSRDPQAFVLEDPHVKVTWVITSPPYYGMRTYIPDQWLRHWFVGGRDAVDYTVRGQVRHTSPEEFVADLAQVWRNVAAVAAEHATLIIRFGGIADRHVNPRDLIGDSLAESSWRIIAIREAGSAAEGRRQANTFLRTRTEPLLEYDVWATR